MEGEIIFNIDVMLAKRKMSVTELSQRVGITMAYINFKKRQGKGNQGIHACKAM